MRMDMLWWLILEVKLDRGVVYDVMILKCTKQHRVDIAVYSYSIFMK